MLIVDKLAWKGLRWVLNTVATAVESEMDDPQALREELLAAQMRYELGEIGDEDLAEVEARVMARLRELKEAERAQGRALGGADMSGISVTIEGPAEDDPRGP